MKQIGTDSEREMARRIACKVLRRLPSHVPAADVHQAALIGLWKALQGNREGFTEEQNRAYLYRRIYGSIIDELRRLDWFSRDARSKEHPPQMHHAAVNESITPDRAHTPEELLSNKQLVSCAVGRLSERHQTVAISTTIGHKQRDLAPTMGVSEARISQLYREAISEMRSALNGET